MKRNKKKLFFYIVITVAIMAFIFLQSALSADQSMQQSNVIVKWLAALFHADAESLSFLVRKCAHFLEYLVLGISLLLTVRELFLLNLRKSGIIAFMIGVVYAITDELHQLLVNGRSGEIRDVLIDAGGVLVGVLITCLICHLRNRKRSG
ncbi:MAG: VanZ family protein [Lachnospiraceae bacterium]|nr:VanZ family protein [Lachnospiraceae bacterium]